MSDGTMSPVLRVRRDTPKEPLPLPEEDTWSLVGRAFMGFGLGALAISGVAAVFVGLQVLFNA